MREAHEWEARYQEDNTGWDRGGPSPALATWLESGALTPNHMLIPGCGRGHEVAAFARHGFSVTAVDFAPSAVAHVQGILARENLNADVQQVDVLKWQPTERFDAIYEQTCLCALPDDVWQEYAERLHSWLRPGGRLYALFMQTGQPGGPPRHCDLLQMHQIFDHDKWKWPGTEPLFVPHRNGRFELGYILTRK